MIDQRPPVDPDQPYSRVFLFSIGSLKEERTDLYASTRGYWKVSQQWREHEDAIGIGIINKISESAYLIKDWHPDGEKFEFTGDALGDQHELLHRDFRSVISAASGYWGYGSYLIVEFDGKGRFRILLGRKDKNWIELPSHSGKSTAKNRSLPPSNISTWIFQINPKDYDLREKGEGFEEDWYINKYKTQIRPGDRAVIWQSGPNPGVYGIGEITSEPFVRGTTEDGRDEMAVNLKLLHVWDAPAVSKSQFSDNPVLANMPIVTAPMGTNFRVSTEQWAEIKSLLPNLQPTIDDEITLADKVARGFAGGGGFQRDVERKRVVEQWAMKRAEEYFVQLGWNVNPKVAMNKPYDLQCTKGGAQELRVEVKGTETAGIEVLLTRGEVDNTKNHSHTALFVVYNIAVAIVDGKPMAAGGETKIIDHWSIDEKDLEATQYRYKVPE